MRRQPVTAKPLADLIGGLVAPHCRKRGVANLALMLEPADIFGARFARAASVERIIWPRDEGPATLVVCAHGAAALALQHVAPQVVERANLIIGWPAIGKLRVTQAGTRRPTRAPAQPKPSAAPDTPAPEVSGVLDQDLKAALARLGQAVTRRSLSKTREPS